MAKIGGHDERCAVFDTFPDGGPSQRPCDCRSLLGDPGCSGVAASWCPVHGDCVCDREAGELNDEACSLHCIASTHATEV